MFVKILSTSIVILNSLWRLTWHGSCFPGCFSKCPHFMPRFRVKIKTQHLKRKYWAKHFQVYEWLNQLPILTCEGRDGACDWFSWLAHICCTGCILHRELRWFKVWFKTQWPGAIFLEAWDTLWAVIKRCIKIDYYY